MEGRISSRFNQQFEQTDAEKGKEKEAIGAAFNPVEETESQKNRKTEIRAAATQLAEAIIDGTNGGEQQRHAVSQVFNAMINAVELINKENEQALVLEYAKAEKDAADAAGKSEKPGAERTLAGRN